MYICIYILVYNEVYTINNDYNCNSRMAVYLIECRVCGEQYTGSTKTKFLSRANNYKSTHRKFISKKEVPKQALKQKRFHDHYCTESHTGIEDWVTTLMDRADTLNELRKKELYWMYKLKTYAPTVLTKGKSMKRFEKKFLHHACIEQ